jgi:hypothetical protein
MAVNVPFKHCVCVAVDWLVMDVAALFVSTTSSVDAVHGLFEMVHVNVALVPAGTPVTPEL